MARARTTDPLSLLAQFRSPYQVQELLDQLAYSVDPIYRSPARALRDGVAHCVDGALLAAAALRRQRRPALVLWIDAENDDGHMLALYREKSGFGAIGKSNCVGLRYREPIYRTLRELLMSYFDEYFNTKGDRSMRSYRRPMDLARHDHLEWETAEHGLEQLLDIELEKRARIPLLSPAAAAKLLPVDARRLKSQFLGARPEGLFVPR